MNNSILQFLWLILISFFCSFAKALNNYAKLSKRKQNFLLFISEVLLSGICGILIGIICMYIFEDVYIIIFCGGLGGLLGVNMVKIMFKILLALKDIDIDLDDIEDDNKKDRD